MTDSQILQFQGEAKLPTRYGQFGMRAYARMLNDRMPHLLMYQQPTTDFSQTVNVRIHSECITGDLFGSRRCECGEQLDRSMEIIGKQGGVLIYLRQEGRGIGIINKLHAYVKQDEGLDTAEANKALGFEYDDRNYSDAITMLEDLNISSINLFTNNPEKVSAFVNSNIEVVQRIPIDIMPKSENIKYLRTKKEFFGHFINSL